MQREFTFMCIINNEKWESLENRDELVALEQSIASLTISNVVLRIQIIQHSLEMQN